MSNNNQSFYSLIDFCSTELFNKKNQNHIKHPKIILPEAVKQTVLPLVFNALEGKCDLTAYQSQYFSVISKNTKIFEEHKSIHKILTENSVPYVFLKGCASARYYPEPLLRTMGDVDLLVSPQDTEKVDRLLLSAGYEKYADSDDDDIHIGYKSKNGVVCELHRQINGIPKNETGDKISKLFSNIFEKSVLASGEYNCPSDFHHGLIMLLHTATHLTHEGIGLRHLCDWAVFIEKFSDKEFCAMYKKPLEEIGLWKFACILSACSIKYLGCSPKESSSNIDSNLIDNIIEDIFSGGNFGRKDYSRYQQIKYISSHDSKTVNSRHPISQVLSNLVTKTKNELKFTKKFPILLPFGCIIILFKYLFLVATNQRKLDNKKVISDANKRKDLYEKLKIFKAK